MTHPHDRPAPSPTPSRPRPRRPLPRRLPFGLSVISIVATGLAAITATFAASYLGVAGTVIGAALFSIMTSVGKEVYDKSLRRTGNVVREVVPVTRVLPRPHDGAPAHAGLRATPRPAAVQVGADGPDAIPAAAATRATDDDVPPILPVSAPRTGEATKWRRIAISAVAVFVAVLAVITGVELIGGRPVSDLVRGDGGSGTSFFGHVQLRTQTKTVPPVAPTMTVTVTPKVAVTTPTVTQVAPTVTRTNSTPAPSSSGASSAGTSPTAGATRTTGTPTPSRSKTP